MKLIEKLATEHMRTENAFESEIVRVERAYIAGFRKAREMSAQIVEAESDFDLASDGEINLMSNEEKNRYDDLVDAADAMHRVLMQISQLGEEEV